jgi:hypothetical protein
MRVGSVGNARSETLTQQRKHRVGSHMDATHVLPATPSAGGDAGLRMTSRGQRKPATGVRVRSVQVRWPA